jgi:hypothetical protein
VRSRRESPHRRAPFSFRARGLRARHRRSSMPIALLYRSTVRSGALSKTAYARTIGPPRT